MAQLKEAITGVSGKVDAAAPVLDALKQGDAALASAGFGAGTRERSLAITQIENLLTKGKALEVAAQGTGLLDADKLNRTQIDKFRDELRTPVQEARAAVERLLEPDLAKAFSPEQKKLLEDYKISVDTLTQAMDEVTSRRGGSFLVALQALRAGSVFLIRLEIAICEGWLHGGKNTQSAAEGLGDEARRRELRKEQMIKERELANPRASVEVDFDQSGGQFGGGNGSNMPPI